MTSKNRSLSKIIGALVNGRFHLITIDSQFHSQKYHLHNKQIFNDGYPHQIQLDLKNNRLIMDGIHNESLANTNNRIKLNTFQLFPDGHLNGWLQDLRINSQFISLLNTTKLRKDFNIIVFNMKRLESNPCYPKNPCQNQGYCLVTSSCNYL